MKTAERGLKVIAEKSGILLFIMGLFLLGPVGFALLGGLSYAMYFSNLALGIVCMLILFSPLFFIPVWVILLGATLITEGVDQKAASPVKATTASG